MDVGYRLTGRPRFARERAVASRQLLVERRNEDHQRTFRDLIRDAGMT